MRRMMGYVRGAPKILSMYNTNTDFLKNNMAFSYRCRSPVYAKHRQFPLLSKFDENGVRVFTNDMYGKIVYIDKPGSQFESHSTRQNSK